MGLYRRKQYTYVNVKQETLIAKKSGYSNLMSHIVSQQDYSKDMSLTRPNQQQMLDFASISNKAKWNNSWLGWSISGELEFSSVDVGA